MAAGTPTNGGNSKSNDKKKPSPEEIAAKKTLDRRYVNMTQISNRMGVTTNTILSWRLTKNFPAFQRGGRWNALEKDIRAWDACQKKGEIFEYDKADRVKNIKSE